ncbi:MAG: hypothetical protein DBW99_03160 [SAR86 cluster bacterium]|jgi:hypothetical protein|nr:hypothetical protein [Gammaproteobacteria bacterium]MAV24303.1 hypothetical protein [Gammaproteobacteria bacterium]RCL35735.1 MAG: hypothetical protein DBW99_03160 [SAR86 cluster bacterium]URQ69472.1 hypothetical protein M9C80_05935 [SAR86 cluster bacterium]|tara:strand:- start:3442 stop:3666 length:225 start_codon:yes stop_codon:yes gene_type:complete
MNKTEKTAFREALIVVLMGAIINFPLQTFLLWLTIDSWKWSNPLTISLFTQTIITVVALVRVFSIRMRFKRGRF